MGVSQSWDTVPDLGDMINLLGVTLEAHRTMILRGYIGFRV